MPYKVLVRLGSVTEMQNTVSEGGEIIEINTIEAVKNSASKLRMKDCFMKAKINTAEWFRVNEKGEFRRQLVLERDELVTLDKLPVPIVAKGIFGSRGTSNYKFNTIVDLKEFLKKRPSDKYIFERYYSYTREYRLHVTEDGCFYSCRKMLKRDAPKETSWQRHDDNCVWFTEYLWEDGKETDKPKEEFEKPVNWDEIVSQCVKALISTGLDVASFDVRVQSAIDPKTNKPREKCGFIIIECNSASSFGKNPSESLVAQKYIEMLPKLMDKKAKAYALLQK